MAAFVLGACGDQVQPSPSQLGLPATTAPQAASERALRPYPDGTLPAFLAADDRFTIFLGLMERDGFLLERLMTQPEQSFTLFAPTDDAFTRLDPRTFAALATDDVLVTGIVERHFLGRRVDSFDFTTTFLITGMSRRASRLALVVAGDRAWFGDALVTDRDISVSGGVVHVIDGVNLGPTPRRIPIG